MSEAAQKGNDQPEKFICDGCGRQTVLHLLDDKTKMCKKCAPEATKENRINCAECGEPKPLYLEKIVSPYFGTEYREMCRRCILVWRRGY